MKKKYKKDDIYVVFDVSKCINSEVCVRGLPSVFNTEKSPWIQVDGADRESIINQVESCPSEALSIKYIKDENV
jgi:uncharacterized Fe-S cluster protein YjdI